VTGLRGPDRGANPRSGTPALAAYFLLSMAASGSQISASRPA
jgi:hypothetical protein